MDPVNPLSGLTELLRKRIASDTSAVREGRAAGRRQKTGQREDVGRVDIAVLRNRISDQIKAIDPDDPARNGKAMRVFVESILAWQFGSNVLNDPQFADLVAEVQGALEKDPAASELLAAVIDTRQTPSFKCLAVQQECNKF